MPIQTEQSVASEALPSHSEPDSLPRLPPSTRPPPPWSRRARLLALAGDKSSKEDVCTQLDSEVLGINRSIYLGFNCFEHARAHWFLYIPYPSSPGAFNSIGKVIQVTGNPFVGFGFQIKLNHNALQQPETHYLLLGSVPSSIIVDDYTPSLLSGPAIRDRPLPGDRLEQIAYDLGLPHQDSTAVLPPPRDPVWLKPHPQFERCQEWMRNLIGRYVSEGILPSSALEVPNEATSVGLRPSRITLDRSDSEREIQPILVTEQSLS